MDLSVVLEEIRNYLLASGEIQRQMSETCIEDISRAATLIAGCLHNGGKVLLCGNGGSAADCQHMASELVSRLTAEFERPGLAAIALTTDTSFLTAHSNDVGFEGVFARQVQALGKAVDVLLGISTSGGSPNVLEAVRMAREVGMKVVALTGRDGALAGLADAAIRVPSASTQHIQEAHLAVEHILCHLIERELFPRKA